MRIQRIQWAGILVENQGVVIMIDPIFNSYNPAFFGDPHEKLYELSYFKKPDIIAITHLHSDHFDPVSIRRHFGENVKLIVPKLCAEEVKGAGFNSVIGLESGENYKYKNIDIIAERSVDGLGDEQVSWIIRNNKQTLIHCGDTLWHGYWWKIVNKYGPIDVAFLPINSAIVNEDGMTPSAQPICMGPDQAIAAATILKTRVLVPIHYGTFNNPPIYNEITNPINRLIEREVEFEIKILKNTEDFIL
ncbi:MAG: MBL fold metallo-hydrolase [Bacillota bacterium]|nr:MBL fold metallo-hydrolase [Bacillota bacterium]